MYSIIGYCCVFLHILGNSCEFLCILTLYYSEVCVTTCTRTNIVLGYLRIYSVYSTYVCCTKSIKHIRYIRKYVFTYMCAINFIVYTYIMYRYDPLRSKHHSVDPHTPSGGLLVPSQSTPASRDGGGKMLDEGSRAERKMTSTRSQDVVEPCTSLNDLKARITISSGGVSNRWGKRDMINTGGRPGDNGLRLSTSKPVRLMSLNQVSSSISQGKGDNIEVCIRL